MSPSLRPVPVMRLFCPRCAYVATVSGGRETSSAGAATTIRCFDCRQLRDVVPGGRCPVDARHRVALWRYPEECPRCSALLRWARGEHGDERDSLVAGLDDDALPEGTLHRPLAAAFRALAAEGVGGAARVGFYPSCGSDTRPLVVLSRPYLEWFGAADAAVDVFVYSDDDAPWRRDGLRHADASTSLRLEGGVSLGLDERVDVFLANVDGSRGNWRTPVIAVKAENREVGRALREIRVRVHTFVGVKDGCRLSGRRDHWCVNEVQAPAHRRRDRALGPPHGPCDSNVPEWWVSDHFDALQARRGEHGNVLLLPGPAGPIELRRRGLLAQGWGYGDARLYRVVQPAPWRASREARSV